MPRKEESRMNLKFWKPKEMISTSRDVKDIEIVTQEGIAGTKIISVKGWNSTEAFELYKKVRNEINHKE
jgi:hypothetical protein